jgi:hypothetical protein
MISNSLMRSQPVTQWWRRHPGIAPSRYLAPDKVRVSVRGYFDVKGPNVVDWAPGLKKLGGWVHR